jgi:DNA-binding MarR family transcriptional regulator
VRRDPDPSDRRRHVLRLTGEGEAVLRKVRSRRTAWLASRLKALSPDELVAVEAALEPLARLLEVDA